MIKITPDEFWNMVDTETPAIGKTIEMAYLTGPNNPLPVRIKITGFTQVTRDYRRVDYLLHNPNTEKYATPLDMTFDKAGFLAAIHFPSSGTLDYYAVVDEDINITPAWEV